jgi:Thioredoxin-related protein
MNSSAQADKLGQITGGAAYEVPTWFTDSFLDISEDVEDAMDDNKSVLLYFHLDNCPYCSSMLDQNFKSGDNLAFIQKHFSVIAVNLKGDREITLNEDEALLEKELSKILKVQYTPTIIFIGEDGKQAFRTNGYRTPKAFRQVLEYVVSQSYKKPRYQITLNLIRNLLKVILLSIIQAWKKPVIYKITNNRFAILF